MYKTYCGRSSRTGGNRHACKKSMGQVVHGSEDPRRRKQTLPNISQNLMIKYAYLLYPTTDFQQQGHNNYFMGTLCNCLYKACMPLYSKILNEAAVTE